MVISTGNNRIAGLAGWRAVFARASVVLLTLVLFWTRPLAAADIEPIRMGYVHFPPHSYTEDGKAVGLQIEIARKLFAILDLKYEMVEMPALRLIRDLGSGSVHIWIGLNRSPKLISRTLASKKPTGTIRLTLYSMRLEQPLSLVKLNHEKLILIKGFSYGGLIRQPKFRQKNLILLEATDHLNAFSMLKAGRAEYLLDYARPSKLAMQGIGLQNVDQQLVDEIPIHILVSKRAPQPEKLLSMLEETMKLLPASNYGFASELSQE